MALNPLAIAHLGFAYKPIVAAMLGLWDEIVEAIVEMQRGGGGSSKKQTKPQAKQNMVIAENGDLEDLAMIFQMLRSVTNG